MKSLAELKALRDKARSNMGMREDAPDNTRIVVGMAKEVRYMPAMGLNNLLIIL